MKPLIPMQVFQQQSMAWSMNTTSWNKNIYQVEVLNQLDQVPAVGALISIAFPHWDKATGSPVRAIAILP